MKSPPKTLGKKKEEKAWGVYIHAGLYAVYPTEGLANQERERLEYPNGKHSSFNPYPGITVSPVTVISFL